MSWRGSTTVSDRIFACLPYLLPVIEVFRLQKSLQQEFPPLALQGLFSPLDKLVDIYNRVPYAGLIIFFALFFFVIRNEKISHFVRFNTMQAILLDIVIFLFSILIPIIGVVPAGGFAIQTLSTTIFFGIMAGVVYSIAQSVLGRYAEIPAISDAVYMQLPR